jgi:hypothetical protein
MIAGVPYEIKYLKNASLRVLWLCQPTRYTTYSIYLQNYWFKYFQSISYNKWITVLHSYIKMCVPMLSGKDRLIAPAKWEPLFTYSKIIIPVSLQVTVYRHTYKQYKVSAKQNQLIWYKVSIKIGDTVTDNTVITILFR